MTMVCCVMGAKTDAGAENHPIYVSHRMMILEAVEDLIQSGVDTFYSTLEAGYEVWCARIVLGLKKKYPNVRLICVAGYKDIEDEEQQSIHDAADLIMFVGGGLDEQRRFMAMQSGYLLNLHDDDVYTGGIVSDAATNNHRLTVVKPI